MSRRLLYAFRVVSVALWCELCSELDIADGPVTVVA
jgi:hypothetical protein